MIGRLKPHLQEVKSVGALLKAAEQGEVRYDGFVALWGNRSAAVLQLYSQQYGNHTA
jgi:hypothetical protein